MYSYFYAAESDNKFLSGIYTTSNNNPKNAYDGLIEKLTPMFKNGAFKILSYNKV